MNWAVMGRCIYGRSFYPVCEVLGLDINDRLGIVHQVLQIVRVSQGIKKRFAL
jgi:hypothetical protein